MFVLLAIPILILSASVAGTPPETALTGDTESPTPRSVLSVSRPVDHRGDGLPVANESVDGVDPGVFGLDPEGFRPLTVLSEAERASAASHVDPICPDHEPCGP